MLIADAVSADRHPLPNRSHARSHVGDAIHFQLALKADPHPAIWTARIAAHWVAAEPPDAAAHQNGGNGLPRNRTYVRPIHDDSAEFAWRRNRWPCPVHLPHVPPL